MTNVNIPLPTVTHDSTGNRNDFIPQPPPAVPPGRYLHFDDRGNLRSMSRFDGNGRHAQETIGSDGSRYFVTTTDHDTQFHLINPRDPATGDRLHYDFTMAGADPQGSAIPPPNPKAGSPTTFTHYDNGKVKDIYVPQPPPSVAPGKYVQFDKQDDLAGMDMFDGNGRHVFQETFAPDGSTYAVINDDKGSWFHLFWPRIDANASAAKGVEVDLNSGRGVMDFTIPGRDAAESGTQAGNRR